MVLVVYLEIRDLVQYAWKAYRAQWLVPQPMLVPVSRVRRPTAAAKTFSITS